LRWHRHAALGVVHSTLWPWYPAVEVDAAGPFLSGDLNGDGSGDADISVDCGNGGGTAAGDLGSADVIVAASENDFTGATHPIRVLGIVRPRQPEMLATHPPYIGRVEILPGKVIAYEDWYGPNDSDCCPSGRATTIWTYSHGKLTPSRTVIDLSPSR
jgi:hypothetical protein